MELGDLYSPFICHQITYSSRMELCILDGAASLVQNVWLWLDTS